MQRTFWPAFGRRPLRVGVLKTFTTSRVVRYRPRWVRGPYLTEARMAIGTVKWFNAGKGFGFI